MRNGSYRNLFAETSRTIANVISANRSVIKSPVVEAPAWYRWQANCLASFEARLNFATISNLSNISPNVSSDISFVS